jgi:hypothetical protein
VEFRRKRPVMVAMDLVRFAAQATVPIAYLLGWLTFGQLLLVTVVVAGAKIAFQAASGAHLKALVAPADLVVANGRFESTTWSSLVVGPPLGGAAIGLVGATASLTADAVSWRYLPTHQGLRGLFCNRLMVASLILCTEPLLAVLMLAHLHFRPWQ